MVFVVDCLSFPLSSNFTKLILNLCSTYVAEVYEKSSSYKTVVHDHIIRFCLLYSNLMKRLVFNSEYHLNLVKSL